jgi:hypothetical protein
MENCKVQGRGGALVEQENLLRRVGQTKTYWLCGGNFITCDCVYPIAANELAKDGIAETMTWKGDLNFLSAFAF